MQKFCKEYRVISSNGYNKDSVCQLDKTWQISCTHILLICYIYYYIILVTCDKWSGFHRGTIPRGKYLRYTARRFCIPMFSFANSLKVICLYILCKPKNNKEVETILISWEVLQRKRIQAGHSFFPGGPSLRRNICNAQAVYRITDSLIPCNDKNIAFSKSYHLWLQP